LSFFSKPKIGLALGGGVSRGGAHLGVLKALENHNIPIDIIAGTSAGSIAGGLYAAGLSADELISILEKLTWLNLTKFQISPRAMLSSMPIEDLVKKYIGEITFAELKIPFATATTDILTGESIMLSEPSLKVASAIRASSSFPGIYSPTKINNRYLFDGGVTNNLPVNFAKEIGADVVIAVDVIPHVTLKKSPSYFTLLADRALDLLLTQASETARKEADIVLTPVTEQIDSFQIKEYPKLIELGIKAVEDNIDKIKQLSL
jgi:NTE family protein